MAAVASASWLMTQTVLNTMLKLEKKLWVLRLDVEIFIALFMDYHILEQRLTIRITCHLEFRASWWWCSVVTLFTRGKYIVRPPEPNMLVSPVSDNAETHINMATASLHHRMTCCSKLWKRQWTILCYRVCCRGSFRTECVPCYPKWMVKRSLLRVLCTWTFVLV